MIFNSTKFKLISILSYIPPFGFINAFLLESFEGNEFLKFNVIQGFIVNLLYFLFLLIYLMLSLLIGGVPFIGYIKNLLGVIFLAICFYITYKIFIFSMNEEIYKIPFIGFLVDDFEKGG
jgi:uncharacterized membrane protein